MKTFRRWLALLSLVVLSGLPAAQAVTCTDSTIPPANPDSVYTVNGDGTVSDTRNGLIWKQCAEGQSGTSCSGSATSHSWGAALRLAAASNFAGHSDWRLPNVKELLSLVEDCRTHPSINNSVFPNTSISYFWSGSPYANYSGYAWIVYFGYGIVNRIFRYGGGHVRLVRGGQSFGPFALTVSSSGSGSGTLVGNGINCSSAAGISSGTCAAALASGTPVTLSATPASGSTFTGWGGACSGAASTCPLTMDAAQSVTASFNRTGVPPSPPTISAFKAGSGSATIYFLAPSDNGGSAITSYTASCTSGQTMRTTTGTASPLTVKNLTGGVLYQCSLTATNGSGLTSSASASTSITAKKNSLTPILMLLLD